MDKTEYSVDLIVVSRNGDPENLICEVLSNADLEVVALHAYEREGDD